MQISSNSKKLEYYNALVERNPKYIGVFYAAIKTTSVFCIATCRARKPKLENVEFFRSFKEALSQGYRPCKVCNPTENAQKAPEQVERAIQLVNTNPKMKISDQRLREENISPDIVRRWFKNNYGLTFQSYQRMVRVNCAFNELKSGKKTTDTAFDLGYESLSGFGYTYKKLMGKSPANSQAKSVILINRTTTPLGPMFICATDKGICLVEFTDRRMLETEFKDLQKRLDAVILTGENEHIKQAIKELREYFNGKRKTFNVPIHAPGTTFQQLVWASLAEIPFGTTTTYKSQAEKLNKPKALKAIGSANGFNRIAIIIPCHRVIGENGKLTGYGGGIERKQWLIEYERDVNSGDQL